MWALNKSPPAFNDRRGDELVPVSVAATTVRDMPIWKSGVGSVQPLEVVDVKPRVDGQLIRIAYSDAEDVAAGTLLAQIDPRPFRAALAQAMAVKVRDEAQLNNVRLNLSRTKVLHDKGFATDQLVQSQQAQLDALSATLAADQALIDLARLNLDFTAIRAPIAGRLGIRSVNVGAVVHTNDQTGVATVTQMSPIAVMFALPQADLDAIQAADRQATVLAYTNDGARLLARGKLSAIGSQINAANGQIQLKAVFDNRDRALWPGQLITVRLHVGTQAAATIVPTSAVQAGQNGDFVYVMRHDHSVAMRPVVVGSVIDDTTAIIKGLKPGELVVASGQSRLGPGSKVSAKLVPAASR